MKKTTRTIRRRRRECKTDYKARFNLLKSDRARVVVRKTNRYIVGQMVISEAAQDKIISAVSSKELLKMGWPSELKGSLKNLDAAYLTGFVLGKKSKEKKEKVILDMGLNRNVKRSRIYSFLKGLIDSGLIINYNEEVLPDEKDLKKNEKTSLLIEKIKENI